MVQQVQGLRIFDLGRILLWPCGWYALTNHKQNGIFTRWGARAFSKGGGITSITGSGVERWRMMQDTVGEDRKVSLCDRHGVPYSVVRNTVGVNARVCLGAKASFRCLVVSRHPSQNVQGGLGWTSVPQKGRAGQSWVHHVALGGLGVDVRGWTLQIIVTHVCCMW